MRILVVGGDGMLGHRLLTDLSVAHEVRVTVHSKLASYADLGLFHPDNTYDGVDVRRPDSLVEPLADFRPEAVINAVGIVKQRAEAREAVPSIEVNALFPHRLAALADTAGARVIQVSTDCVFSGRRGHYTEGDEPDPVDLYGLTKLVGEVSRPNTITLRTSIIGLELRTRRGLVEWALAQTGAVRGFRRAIYTGVTTSQFAEVAELVLTKFPQLTGIYHLASEPTSKFDLLAALYQRLGRTDAHVVADDSVVCDRSLDGDTFSKATGIQAPSWDAMLSELSSAVMERGRAE